MQEHLDVCERCRVLVAETAGATFAHGSGKAPVRTLTDGEKVGGRYEIRRFIARGGMGEVYEAADLTLGENVALKTLSPTTLDQSGATERLIAEVRLSRKVTHANVCRILEFALHRRQQGANVEVIPVLTMELLEGETLGSRIRRVGRLDPDHAKVLLEDIVAGLGAVHDAGIVHRDFKTENVFLVRGRGGVERAVVMDFGLARAVEANRGAGGSSAHTMIGTVAYMAPEQVEGQPPTPAFDVYALGIVAFEMLTGQLPFVADSPMAVAALRLRKDPPLPSSFRPELGPAWDAVIGRCLARDPKRRFRSVHEVLTALERAQSTNSWRRWLPAPRRRALVTAGCLLVGVALGAATAGDRGSPPPPTAALTAKLLQPPAATLVPPAFERPAIARSARPAAEICESPAVPDARGPEVKRESRARKRGRTAAAGPHPGPLPSRDGQQVEGEDDLIDPFPSYPPGHY